MNKEILSTIVIISIVVALIVAILCFYVDNEIKRFNNEIIQTQSNEVTTLSSRFESRLQYLTGIMEMVSQTSPIIDPPADSNLISEQLKGIPENADVKKREIARMLFDKKFDLDYVFYAMPNGDIYFLEPYASQTKLSQLNFAFRDWYRGATTTGLTYVSEVYVSVNEKHNVIGIAVPIYSEKHTLNGIFVGALNLGSLQQSLATLVLGQNQYFVIIDHNGNIVADSRHLESDLEIEKFDLDFEATDGNIVHTITKTIDGRDMLITYKIMHVGTHEWLFASVQPSDDAFAQSTALKNEAILIMILTILTVGVSGFFLIRKINTNIVLASRLKRIDVEKRGICCHGYT